MKADFEEFAYLAPIITQEARTAVTRRKWDSKLGRWEQLSDTLPNRHIYQDNGSDILAVAHLDSVQKATHFWMNDEYIACPTIDNRLGAYIITQFLPKLGIKTDILLTEGEETGCTTARDFVLPAGKEYKWMFSFDRTGTDVACYQYIGNELRQALSPYGLVAAHGSFSDIAALEDVGCRGMNFGCAMYDYHSLDAYAKVDELTVQLARFLCFYEDYAGVPFPYEPTRYVHTPVKATGNFQQGEYDYYGSEYTGYSHFAQEAQETRKKEEKRKATVLYDTIKERGCNSRLFTGLTPYEWWRTHRKVQSLGEAGSWTTQCKRCFHHFDYNDTLYSSVLLKSFCHVCFMEVMELLEFIPSDWYTYALQTQVDLHSEEKISHEQLFRTAVRDFNGASYSGV